MIFSINLYGLGAVAVLLVLYCLVVLRDRPATWVLASFVGCVGATILPAHIALALLASVGVVGVWAIRIGRSVMAERQLPIVSPAWQRTIMAAGVAGVATVAWGLVTGHGLSAAAGAGASPIVSPFNESWRASIAITLLGAGALLAIPISLLVVRPITGLHVDLYVGTLVLLVAGAIAWGARLSEFTMFYLFFAGIAVIALPVAAVAVRGLWEWLRAERRTRLAVGLVVLCVIQLEGGVWNSLLRMQQFGPSAVETIPVTLLDAIRRLPPDARLAYSCDSFGEITFGVPELLSIDVHTGRRVVPMCFNAEILSTLTGASISKTVANIYFASAPQRALYPEPDSDPSSAAVSSFLKQYEIGYIYADARHPNRLVDDAVPVATSGDAQVLRVP
jgi:hypothetical protein